LRNKVPEELERHVQRLRTATAASLLALGIPVAVVFSVPRPHARFPEQGATLFWILLFATVVNLVTVMPSYHYLLATPRRAYEVSREPRPLLTAHAVAHTISLLRFDLIALFGLALFFLAGRRDWFWLFEGAAVLATLILWPRRRKLEGLVELPGES
jgi:hypothetical protein